MRFNPSLLSGGSMPTAYITGTSGNQSAQICDTATGQVPGYAISDFTGGSVTWIGNTMTLGKSGTASPNTAADGVLTFPNGTITFSTIVVGNQSVSAGAPGVGTINIGTNATLQANTSITLGATTGTINAGTAGTINVNTNGTLLANIITNGGAGSTVNMTNANWTVSVTNTAITNMTVANFNSGGTTNVINISFITPLLGSSYPVRFHLISAGTITGGSTLGLGTLPTSYNPSQPYVGYLDTTSNPNLVDLVLASGPSSARLLTWTGTNGGGGTNVLGGSDSDWDLDTTMDWLTAGSATFYNQFDLVTFPDVTGSATSYVNLTTTLTPYSITVSNNSSLYTFGGGGSISGVTGLTKSGTGTLILDNSTSNNFTGGITISSGILQIGTNDTGGSLPAGVSVADSSILADDQNGTLSLANTISGSGTVVSTGGGALATRRGQHIHRDRPGNQQQHAPRRFCQFVQRRRQHRGGQWFNLRSQRRGCHPDHNRVRHRSRQQWRHRQ